RCPSCDKDPGRAEDYCPRCGADLETGGPGPDATMCSSCSRVVKKGAAVCPRCALPIERSRIGHRETGSGWLDRLIVLGAVTGCFYFLVYRHVIAPVGPAAAVEPDAPTPGERVHDALAKGDAEAVAKALGDAVKEDGHDPALEPAYALALLRAGKKEDARGAIFDARQKRPDDVDLILVASEIAVAASDLDAARRVLGLVPQDKHDDRYHREQARIAEAAKDGVELEKAIKAIQSPLATETHRLAELHLERGLHHAEEKRYDAARDELEQAVVLGKRWALAHEKLGVVFLELRKWDAAEIQFGRALELEPEKPDLWLGIALARDRRHDTVRALDDYRAFLRKATDPRYEAQVKAVNARIAVLDKGK
ncbi:MAG: zinc ribbon domain-containing protein, partial [Planctomycetota bacterium]